ncbi:hypothetical protein [Paraburkholderia sabiae]|uniref:hypothetical protein n=1 Tax=Paraburkholderia sabiae TaxID=273251 RepID=UPI00319E3B5F
MLDVLRRRFDAGFSGAGRSRRLCVVPRGCWWSSRRSQGACLREARVQRDQAASRATALLDEILRREQEGDQHELIGLRQEFSRLHAPLFEVYMATRKVRHR